MTTGQQTRPETLEEAIERAVERGLRWAVSEYGLEAVLAIDTEALDLSSTRVCVVGQLQYPTWSRKARTTPYSEGIRRHPDYEELASSSSEKRFVHLGFDAGYLEYDGEGVDDYVDYDTLTDYWRDRLARLKATGHIEV